MVEGFSVGCSMTTIFHNCALSIHRFQNRKDFALTVTPEWRDNWKAKRHAHTHTVVCLIRGWKTLTLSDIESVLPYIESHSPSTNVLCASMLAVVVV